MVEEFIYIYSKINGEEVDFLEVFFQEYFDFYVKFKLKVQWVKEMCFDIIVVL